MADDARAIPELAAAVARVAEGGMLTAVYQPIYSLKSGTVIGYESLVRLKEDADFPSTTSLFVAAEATTADGRDRRRQRPHLPGRSANLTAGAYLSLNLSPRTLESDAFSPLELLVLTKRSGIDPSQLVVELTEREAVEDLDRLRASLAILKRHGVRIAADDVGAGNAGLRLLSEVDFDIIKIDLSLVRAGARHEPSEAVLRASRRWPASATRRSSPRASRRRSSSSRFSSWASNTARATCSAARPSLAAPTLVLVDLMTGKVPETESAA